MKAPVKTNTNIWVHQKGEEILDVKLLKTNIPQYQLPNVEAHLMEPTTGFEPVTSSLPRTRSTNWAKSAYMPARGY